MAELTYNKEFKFEFIAVETSDPSVAMFYPVDDKELVKWKNVVQGMLYSYKACLAADTWPKPATVAIKDLYLL